MGLQGPVCSSEGLDIEHCAWAGDPQSWRLDSLGNTPSSLLTFCFSPPPLVTVITSVKCSILASPHMKQTTDVDKNSFLFLVDDCWLKWQQTLAGLINYSATAPSTHSPVSPMFIWHIMGKWQWVLCSVNIGPLELRTLGTLDPVCCP